MHDIDHREHAQLGLIYIEDAIVSLLTEHRSGMSPSVVAEALGLGADADRDHRSLVAAGILELLLQNGRILWDAERNVYLDNPERH